jgi:stearoyl-CoA desaturase (delta-9 desaturase)
MITRERALAGFVVVAPALGVIAALLRWAAGAPPSTADTALVAIGSLLAMVGVELGYHRYFAHRAFEAHPAFAWLLGALGSSALLGPVMWWVATHRRHHARTDREGDPHSPHWPHSGARGVWHAHAGWLFLAEHTAMSVTAAEVKDLWKNPRTVAAHRGYLGWGALGLAVPTAIGASRAARGALSAGFCGAGSSASSSSATWCGRSTRSATCAARALAFRARGRLATTSG